MKEERFSSGTPSKNKISNFGAICPLYPNFIYLSLSLSLSLSLLIWRKTKEQKRRKTFMSMDCSIHYIYLTLWKCISLYSKGFMYFYVTTWSKLFFGVLLRICCVTFPFQLLFALCYLAENCPINSFKISHGKPELPTTTI